MKPAHPRRPARPLLVVGWDGATPELAFPWMADGTLPNLAALAARGARAKLRSLVHPLSPAAWTSATTGLNPGRHGIWDFGQRSPGGYEVRPTTAAQRSGATLWDVAGCCGLRSVVVNVPLTHPAGPFPGLLVPGVGISSPEGATWPRSLASRIRAEVPGYRVDANAYEHADPAAFLSASQAMTRARADLAERLLRSERPDLLVCVFVLADRVQHAFWKQADLPWTGGERSSWRFASSIRDAYVELDAALGRLVLAAGPDATVVVVSDHGFGDLDGDLFLNSVLEGMGLLAVRRPQGRGRPGRWRSRAIDRLARLLDAERRAGEPALPEVMADGTPTTLAAVDWERTRAFSAGLFGNVWLNLRGREPRGQVEPGPEAERTMEAIASRLLDLSVPGTGLRLVDAVFRGGDLFRGPRAGAAPDLVVVPREYRYLTRAGREIGPPGVLVAAPAVAHTGNHRMDGILVAGGPGIGRADELGTQRLLDVAPTALALLGIEVPLGLDGRPMRSLLSCDVGWTDELPWREAAGSEVADAAGIEAQLRGLGYLAG